MVEDPELELVPDDPLLELLEPPELFPLSDAAPEPPLTPGTVSSPLAVLDALDDALEAPAVMLVPVASKELRTVGLSLISTVLLVPASLV